jgi:hypothetical protein
MLPGPPKFYPRTGHESLALATLPLKGNVIPTVQEAEWAPGPVWTHAENLVPTAGFHPQIIKPEASCYTYVVKAYRGSSGIAPP